MIEDVAAGAEKMSRCRGRRGDSRTNRRAAHLKDTIQVMSRFVAFLRAVNVAGRRVKMDDLRHHFESIGFSEVETYIASGNVVFATPAVSPRSLEKGIEKKLREALGFEVAVFVRTEAELAAIGAYKPFRPSNLESAVALNIAFLTEPLVAASKRKLMALKTEIDDFHIHGREIYWLCRKKQSESTFSNAVLEKTLGCQATLRGANTIKKMAAKYVGSES